MDNSPAEQDDSLSRGPRFSCSLSREVRWLAGERYLAFFSQSYGRWTTTCVFYKSVLIYCMCQCLVDIWSNSAMNILIHKYKNIPARWKLWPLDRHKTWFGWFVWFKIMNALLMSKVSNTTYSKHFPTVPKQQRQMGFDSCPEGERSSKTLILSFQWEFWQQKTLFPPGYPYISFS